MLSLVYAQSTGGNAPAPQGDIMSILPMILIMFVIFYFFIIRPQSKKQKELQKMLEGVKKGDKVITAGGMLALVTDVKGGIVTLKIAPNVEVEFRKSAVSTVVTPEVEKEMKTEIKKG